MLRTSRADDSLFAEKEQAWLGVAGLCHGSKSWAAAPDFLQHRLPANAIESVSEVHLKDPFLVHGNPVVGEDFVGGVDDRLGAAFDANAELKRDQVVPRIDDGFLGGALGGPAAEGFANCDGTTAAVL